MKRSSGFGFRASALLVGIALFASVFAACNGEDRPGGVSVIDEGTGSPSASGSMSGSVSASGTGSPTVSAPGTGSPSPSPSPSGSVSASGTGSPSASGSASGSATGTGNNGGSPVGLGGYLPASDVAAHARVTRDIAEINALLNATTPIDWAAVKTLYEEGKNSPSGTSLRTLAGFARSEGRSEPIWDDYTDYYNDPIWLDTYVMHALDGTGPFDGEPDGVRKQGAQKGIQNQIMIAWVIHELVAAMQKAEDGSFDPASGAPHNWDEAWAFYHGVDPNNAPYSTATKRSVNFGTGNAVNEAILAAMERGRDALVNGNAAEAQVAMDEVLKQVRITYIQATIRYAKVMADDVAAGNAEAARTHQTEGWAFYRVIEPQVAVVNEAAATTINEFYDLAAGPSADGADAVRTALESVYSAWGISGSEVGTLQ